MESLARATTPKGWPRLDTDNTSQELLDRFEVTPSEIPVVICSGRSVLRNPSNQEIADCLGFNTTIDETQVHDLIIVGAGPAGLAAAVYAGSEGLDVLMIEPRHPEDKRDRAPKSKVIWASQQESPARSWRHVRLCKPKSSEQG